MSAIPPNKYRELAQLLEIEFKSEFSLHFDPKNWCRYVCITNRIQISYIKHLIKKDNVHLYIDTKRSLEKILNEKFMEQYA